MDKKNVAVVFGLTKNFSFAVACVMMDLKKFSSSWVSEVVIIHDGISEAQQQLLNNILPCRFVLYNFPIKNNSIFDKKILNYFSKMVFSKFECLRLLSDYRNVVWLDYDIVLLGDISSLTNYCKSGIKMVVMDYKVRDQLNESVSNYNMDLNGVNSGVFVFQDHICDYKRLYDFCYKSTEQYAKYLYLPEQAIFDFMIQEFNINIDFLDKGIYCVHPDNLVDVSSTKIIHAYGPKKFWNEITNKQWQNNYQEWLRQGGKKYNLRHYFLAKGAKNFFKKIGFYDVFKKIVLKIKK